jgi:sugar lactone lactonase YvrE
MTSQFIAKPFYEPSSEDLRYLPEGPRVLRNMAGNTALGWVAIQHGADATVGSINVLDLTSGQNQSFLLPGRPGFFAETVQPGLVLIGLERRLVYFDLCTGHLEETGIDVTDDERVIINDGLAVEGGVLFGTKDLELTRPFAAVYFFDSATRCVHTVFGDQVCSNGKHLRRDAEGATLVDIDSVPGAIGLYRLDAKLEQVLSKSLVPATHFPAGQPDGLRPAPNEKGETDGESVVVAFYDSGEVADGAAQQIRVEDGAVLCEWLIPGAPRVTCPEFVEIEGAVKLVFTTAVGTMSPATRRIATGAGALYLADTPFHTMPAAPPLVSL